MQILSGLFKVYLYMSYCCGNVVAYKVSQESTDYETPLACPICLLALKLFAEFPLEMSRCLALPVKYQAADASPAGICVRKPTCLAGSFASPPSLARVFYARHFKSRILSPQEWNVEETIHSASHSDRALWLLSLSHWVMPLYQQPAMQEILK